MAEMNFSTTSQRNMSLTEVLSPDEAADKYLNLKRQHDALVKRFDACQQELYDTKKNLNFSQDLKEHLTSEIENYTKNELKMKQEFSQKVNLLKEELESARQDKWKENEALKTTVDSLKAKIKVLEQSVSSSNDKSICQTDNTAIYDDYKRLDEEKEALKSSLFETQAELAQNMKKLEQLHDQTKMYEEQVESLKCNLTSKKEEIVSLTDMLHSAQEDLLGASAELQRYKNETGAHAVKGNSLFAEVDDKRQEMVKMMSHMKEKVHQLNRELISKQAEIDALLCEKKTLWEEYAGQADHHDEVLNKAYEHRITDLEKQNDQLQREIARWYDSNLDPSASDITKWVSGVLDYYKDENLRLSNDFAASSVDNLVKEQKLRDLQRQLVAWRTKAVESNATISQLETKLRSVEKSPVKTEIKAKPALEIPNNTSVLKDIENTVDKENITPERIQPDTQLNKPGILVTGNVKNKPVKKATFQ